MLCRLPSEVILAITSSLFGSELIYLWNTGDKLLQFKLSQAKCVKIEWDGSNGLNWPSSYLQSMNHLTECSLSNRTEMGYFGLRNFDAICLNKELKSLSLSFANTPTLLTDYKQVFPSLATLKLFQTTKTFVPSLSSMPTLPSTITRLEINFKENLSSTASVSSRMRQSRAQSYHLPSLLSSLPTLVYFNVQGILGAVEELDHLGSFSSSYSSSQVNDSSSTSSSGGIVPLPWPKGLVTFKISLYMDHPHLRFLNMPPTLTRLRLFMKNSEPYQYGRIYGPIVEVSGHEFWHLLPSSLLELSYAGDFPHPLPHELPSGIKKLRVTPTAMQKTTAERILGRKFSTSSLSPPCPSELTEDYIRRIKEINSIFDREDAVNYAIYSITRPQVEILDLHWMYPGTDIPGDNLEIINYIPARIKTFDMVARYSTAVDEMRLKQGLSNFPKFLKTITLQLEHPSLLQDPSIDLPETLVKLSVYPTFTTMATLMWRLTKGIKELNLTMIQFPENLAPYGSIGEGRGERTATTSASSLEALKQYTMPPMLEYLSVDTCAFPPSFNLSSLPPSITHLKLKHSDDGSPYSNRSSSSAHKLRYPSMLSRKENLPLTERGEVGQYSRDRGKGQVGSSSSSSLSSLSQPSSGFLSVLTRLKVFEVSSNTFSISEIDSINTQALFSSEAWEKGLVLQSLEVLTLDSCFQSRGPRLSAPSWSSKEAFILHLPRNLTKLQVSMEFCHPSKFFPSLPRKLRVLDISCPDHTYMDIRKENLQTLPKSITQLLIPLSQKRLTTSDVLEILPNLQPGLLTILWQH